MDALAQLNASLAGRYSIEREIGRGGMATVYLARDVRHARNVAVKVLNPELGAVLGVERFLSEIQVTANLQHPNLLPLFDSGEAEGLLFYVMPHVEGESLRAKLLREKQLPIDEAVHIATAVASALDYAHRHGVIHRDLKPENILLHEGEPLVADFGIALAVSNAGGHRVTQTGISLGTPQYMSPEQATGDRSVDGRTDVYSLGAVLYEMLTGEPPHSGTTAQAIIAKVITDKPRSIRLSRETVSDHVEAAVERALAKLPADRFHTAHEFADALHGRFAAVALPSGIRTPGTVASHRRARWREVGTWLKPALFAAAMILGASLAAVALWRLSARTSDEETVSFITEPPISDDGRARIANVAISPDGKTLAFVAESDSSSQLYVRRLAQPDARPIAGTNNAFDLAFSPDGKSLAIVTYGGKLIKIPVDGGPALTLMEGATFWGGLTWESDRTILIGVAGDGGLARIPATGGAPHAFTKPASAWKHGRPFVTHDGSTLLFLDWGPGFTEDDYLAIGSLETGKHTRTSLLAVQVIGVVDDHIVYGNPGGAIMAVPFDRNEQRLKGEPVRVMEGVTIGGYLNAALANSGSLAYKRGQPTQKLALLDSSGAAHDLSPEGHIFGNAINNSGRPKFSPDGRHIAVNIVVQRADTLESDIWTFDMRSRTFTRVTYLGNVVGPEWTPDGRHLLFHGWQQAPALWRQVADGSQPPEKLLEPPSGTAVSAANVTPDGRGLVYCYWTVLPDAQLLYLPFAGEGKAEQLWSGRLDPNACVGRVSPDGQWLAYVASDGGEPNVYVRSFRSAGGRMRISAVGGDGPLWSRDGRKLYYRRSESGIGGGSLFAAHLSVADRRLDVVKLDRVVPLRDAPVYDIAPDGKNVLTVRQDNAGVQLVVTMNWISQLRARLAATK